MRFEKLEVIERSTAGRCCEGQSREAKAGGGRLGRTKVGDTIYGFPCSH